MHNIRPYIETLLSGLQLSDTLHTALVNGILVVVAVLLAAASFYLCHRVVVPLVLRLVKHTAVEWDDIIFSPRSLKAACKIVPAILIRLLLPYIFHSAGIVTLLSRATDIYIVITTVWLVLAVIDSLKRFEGERRTALQQYFHTFCGILKVAAVFVAAIVIISIAIGRSPTAIIAGLGATSAVLMLVFKDIITGFVAGLRLTSNSMLHKGDWITVPAEGINGFVQDITLTTVKVLNFDNTIITITPQKLVDGSFQNWRNMQQGDGRRVARKVFIDVHSIAMASDAVKDNLVRKKFFRREDLAQPVINLTLLRCYLENWLPKNPDVNPDMLFMVRQLDATPTGLPLEIYCFIRHKTWKPYEQHAATILEYVYAIIPEFGLRVYQRVSDEA